LLLGRLLSSLLIRFRRLLSEEEAAEERDELRRIELLVPLFVCFVLGAGAGCSLAWCVGLDAILVPAGLSATLGVTYLAFRIAMARRAGRVLMSKQRFNDGTR
jgi:hypothetical protein